MPAFKAKNFKSEPKSYDIDLYAASHRNMKQMRMRERNETRETVSNYFMYYSQGSTVMKVEETSVQRGNIMLLFPDKASFF